MWPSVYVFRGRRTIVVSVRSLVVCEDGQRRWNKTPEYCLSEVACVGSKSVMNTTMIFVSEIEERNENEGLLCVLTVNGPGDRVVRTKDCHCS